MTTENNNLDEFLIKQKLKEEKKNMKKKEKEN